MAKKLVMRSQSGIPGIEDNLNNASTIQTFIRSQIYMMGYQAGVNAGSNPNVPIVLNGAARRLFGIVVYIQQSLIAEDDTFSLTLNNEIIISKCLWRAFNPTSAGNFKEQMFFSIPRPLSGSDSLNISWTAVSAKQIYPIFYLSNSSK